MSQRVPDERHNYRVGDPRIFEQADRGMPKRVKGYVRSFALSAASDSPTLMIPRFP
jgi:hypothetical protein